MLVFFRLAAAVVVVAEGRGGRVEDPSESTGFGTPFLISGCAWRDTRESCVLIRRRRGEGYWIRAGFRVSFDFESSRLNCPGTGTVILATRTRSKGR